jgi:hypothetical protein
VAADVTVVDGWTDASVGAAGLATACDEGPVVPADVFVDAVVHPVMINSSASRAGTTARIRRR